MDEHLKQTKKNINNGAAPIKEAFKLGFLACIKSIEDKGYNKLALYLKTEHSKI